MVRRCAAVLLKLVAGAIVALAALEFCLRALDPVGLLQMRSAQHLINAGWENDTERGYGLADRCYENDYWRYCVENGARVVPGTNTDAGKTLVLLGDSFMFGWGVSDEQTAAYYIAQALPDWHVINAAVPGYNIQQVRAAYDEYRDADAHLYLVVDNDADARIQLQAFEIDAARFGEPMGVMMEHIREYLSRYRWLWSIDKTQDAGAFNGDFAALQDAGVITVSIGGAFGVRGINPPGRLSALDGHLSVSGNEMLAEELIEVLEKRL